MKRRINIDEAMMSSLGLVSEYANVDTDRINKVASNVRSTTIEKYAGIFINNPTQENIEDFIRKYMYNELTFFPRILEVLVEFIPSEFDKSNPDYVSEGTGVVGVKVYHKVVELPFLVRGGELEPFDVIQMDGQRAPYSRENFQKIILNLNRQIEMERESVTADGVQSPYKGLEDYTNTSTTPGFMGDVLAIRDSQSLRRGPGHYVTAGEYDYGFEKNASKKYNVFPFGQENTDSLEHQFEKAVARAEAEKPTMKAPKGTVEKAREEEKLASSGVNEDLVRKAIQYFESPTQYDKKGNLVHLDDESHEAYRTLSKQNPEKLEQLKNEVMSSINPYTKDSMPTPMKQKMKFGDIAGEWFGDHEGIDKLKDADVVLGWPDKRVNTKANYGIRHVLHNPNENKYYYAQFDNDVPSDFDMSRIQDAKKIEEIDPKWVNDFQAKGLLGMPKKAEIITDLNALLEKTASIKPMTDEEFEAISYVLSKKAHDKFVAKLEKMAEEDTELTRRELEIIEKKANFKFTDASQMKHGDFIVFPEIDGSEVSLTPAVVLSNLDNSMVDIKGKIFKFICSIDGRIKVLDGDKFLCARAEDRAFKLPVTGLGSLKEGDTFFALNGNKVLVPSSVRSITAPRIGDAYRYDESSINKICNIFECSTIDSAENKKDIYFSPSSPRGNGRDSWRRGKFSIVSLEGKKFENTTMHEFLEAKSKETGLPQEKINAVIPRWALDVEENGGKLLTSDMQTPVIKVKGVITTNFKTQEEYDTKSRLHEAGYDVEKVAFTTNQVTVYCVDRKQNIFNMTVEYKDTEERFMNLRKQIFNRISKGKLKAILRILQFQGNIISEIVFKAKNEQKAQYPIPANCTIENIKEIQGGDMHNVSKENVKGAIQKYVNPLNIAKGLAVATASGLITDAAGTLAAQHPITPQMAAKLTGFTKFFSESVELSGAFEKAAQDYESEDFLDYARVLALSGHFSEKIATVLNDNNNVYPSIKDVAHEIMLAKPVLEKFAYDLTSLKVNQSLQGREMIPNNIIRGAIENMDTLYKIAYNIDKAIDKSDLKFL